MRTIFSFLLSLCLASPGWTAPFMSPEAVESARNFKKTEVASGLNHPWGMVWLPNGAMLITERSGQVRHFKNNKLLSEPVPGAPEVLAEGQGGLLDIVLHPDFASNGLVYFTQSTGRSQSNRTALTRAVFDGSRFNDVRMIFQVSQSKPGGQHFGSRLLWLPDGTLLMSIGDGGNPPVRVQGELARTYAQNLRSHLGKVLHLDADGRPVPGSPFPTESNALPEIYSAGHRNIQGMAWDPVRKTVWVSEHGALGGDELNRVVPGANYGWPKATFSKEYLFARKISDYTSLPGMADPEVVWTPALAPSGLAVYTGDKFPDWKGDLFAGGLKQQSVRRIKLDTGGQVTGEETIRIGQRVRDVRMGPDGYLYVLTDESDGKLIRIEPSDTTDPNP